jgi:hypothetical protein
LTSKPENTNTNVIIHDKAKPTIEHARKPITLCCKVNFGHIWSLDEPGRVNIESFVGSFPVPPILGN